MTAPGGTRQAQGWTADDATFGARLALVRQRMGWGNVKEAAAACGLPTESWRSWERDGRTPQRIVEIAAVISERTGCDYGWLLAGRRLSRSSIEGTNVRSSPLHLKADHRPPRHVRVTPFSQPRRDPTRPQSVIPAHRRRPTPTRPSGRPIPA